ncbi:MAG: trypsin-like peptidase domain-containing protein [Porticoccus sp.]|nr:trypsin-like peptidase domain-containing protein [Porticoccus sp.]
MMKRVVASVFFFACLFTAPVYSHQLPSFTDLIEKSSPAVVQVDTSQRSASQSSFQMPRHNIPEIFGEKFKQHQGDPSNALASGTGFIISADGYVLTNQHVVDGADEIMIRLSDRREYEANIIGQDKRSDLALLKIEAKGLPAVEFADTSKLKVGEWVLAIGSPFGLDYSASAGIISAIGRSIPTETGDNYVPFIQSDVALNPGNSGGPLLNLEGKVVGVNSLIFSRSGGSIGLSFAVPANVALKVIKQLKSKGYVERGWLGIYIQDVDKNLAESFGLDKPVGALVAQVEPESPAAKAGLGPGDVVLRLNGQDIVHSGDLPHVVGLLAPGEIITVEVIQKGIANKLDIVIGSLPKVVEQATSLLKPDRLGLIISSIGDDGLGSWRTGVLVETVAKGSAADVAGIFKGDVIMQLGYSSIDNPSEYYEVVKKVPVGEPVAIRLIRHGRSIFKSLLVSQ